MNTVLSELIHYEEFGIPSTTMRKESMSVKDWMDRRCVRGPNSTDLISLLKPIVRAQESRYGGKRDPVQGVEGREAAKGEED
jgi:hypothetical protein